MGRVMDELEFVIRERDHLAEVARRLAFRVEDGHEEIDIFAGWLTTEVEKKHELDRTNAHLADVAYRLARRCEVLEVAHNEAVWALWSRNAGPGESLEEWVAQGMADAEAEVAERWPR